MVREDLLSDPLTYKNPEIEMLPQLHHQDLTKNKEAKVLTEVIF